MDAFTCYNCGRVNVLFVCFGGISGRVAARLIVSVLLAGATVVSFAQLPTILNFTGPSTANVHLENIHYDPGTVQTGALSGTGDLICDMGGGNKYTGAATPFSGIFADSAGNVQKNKGGYTFKKDFPWNNMLGTGLNSKLKSGFTISVETSGAGNKVTFTADTECQLPFRDESGTQATLSGTSSKLTIDGPSGQVKFDTNKFPPF